MPGISTTVSNHDIGHLLCVHEIVKLWSTETALTLMARVKRSHPQNFESLVNAALEGREVITSYNNKTYRIARVVFDMNSFGCLPLVEKEPGRHLFRVLQRTLGIGC